jgi:hypothetical protein
MTLKIPIRHTMINKTVKVGVPDEENLTNVKSVPPDHDVNKNEPHGSTLCGAIPNDADCGYCPDLRECIRWRIP